MWRLVAVFPVSCCRRGVHASFASIMASAETPDPKPLDEDPAWKERPGFVQSSRERMLTCGWCVQVAAQLQHGVHTIQAAWVPPSAHTGGAWPICSLLHAAHSQRGAVCEEPEDKLSEEHPASKEYPCHSAPCVYPLLTACSQRGGDVRRGARGRAFRVAPRFREAAKLQAG